MFRKKNQNDQIYGYRNIKDDYSALQTYRRTIPSTETGNKKEETR
jgi:hypothetical protein